MYLEYQENADSDKCMTNIKQKMVKHFVDDHEIFTIKKKWQMKRLNEQDG